jgi:ATP/maltotriose-dependent transcriptional regulator MalT
MSRVRAAVDGLDAGLTETRRIIRDLTPTAVAEAGLEGSLRLLCDRAQQEGAAERVQFRLVGNHRPALDAQSATTLFRVAPRGTGVLRRRHRLRPRPNGPRLPLGLAPEIVGELVGQVVGLRTDLMQREVDVVRLMSDWHSNRSIAESLFLSEATIKTHLVRIYRKLGVATEPQPSPKPPAEASSTSRRSAGRAVSAVTLPPPGMIGTVIPGTAEGAARP